VSVQRTASREDIERRAFQIYMSRGRVPGDDLADWLNAERELSESSQRASLLLLQDSNLRQKEKAPHGSALNPKQPN
jgi:Protein of unknown function (DUF2934)